MNSFVFLCKNEVAHLSFNTRDPGSISGSGRSPGEGNGNPLLYSCLGNPVDGGAWLATKSCKELDMNEYACMQLNPLIFKNYYCII